MRVREPAQQRLALGDLLGRQRRRVGVEVLDDVERLLVHLRPVLDRLADVLQHLGQRALDLLALLVGSTRGRSRCASTTRGRRRAAARPGRAGASSPVRISWSWPVMSRRTRICGCTTMCTSRFCSLSSMVTESTRNGMSSVTTSTTVWPPADQPCSDDGRGEDADVRGALRAVRRGPVLAHRSAVEVHLACARRCPRWRRAGRSSAAARRRSHPAGRPCPCGLRRRQRPSRSGRPVRRSRSRPASYARSISLLNALSRRHVVVPSTRH